MHRPHSAEPQEKHTAQLVQARGAPAHWPIHWRAGPRSHAHDADSRVTVSPCAPAAADPSRVSSARACAGSERKARPRCATAGPCRSATAPACTATSSPWLAIGVRRSIQGRYMGIGGVPELVPAAACLRSLPSSSARCCPADWAGGSGTAITATTPPASQPARSARKRGNAGGGRHRARGSTAAVAADGACESVATGGEAGGRGSQPSRSRASASASVRPADNQAREAKGGAAQHAAMRRLVCEQVRLQAADLKIGVEGRSRQEGARAARPAPPPGRQLAWSRSCLQWRRPRRTNRTSRCHPAACWAARRRSCCWSPPLHCPGVRPPA